jgi:hypothetical protein
MRLWTLHPTYLDAKGLVALWRESLLAQAVLSGKTRGYRHHPQLQRFATSRDPIGTIGRYLTGIHQEACARGYSFDGSRIAKLGRLITIPVGCGQVTHEQHHLLEKLKIRDRFRYLTFKRIVQPEVHALFTVTDGPIEPWERTS